MALISWNNLPTVYASLIGQMMQEMNNFSRFKAGNETKQFPISCYSNGKFNPFWELVCSKIVTHLYTYIWFIIDFFLQGLILKD